MDKVPQIDNGKRPEDFINIVNLPHFPSNTPFGNLLLKGMNIVRRIDKVNLEIRRVFGSYVHPSNQDINNPNPHQDVLEHQFYAEQVVYWLRKTADEIVALAYVINQHRNTGSWPESVQVDSISGLKNSHSEELRLLFKPHEGFLSTLNEIANAFKHSFINTDMTLIGSEYPVVFALGLKYNKLSNQPKFYTVSFAEMITAFSAFYKQSMAGIQGWVTFSNDSDKP
ncbi:MAG: hypothetical protein A2Y79_00300 [Deltaproteobacteria bacterium RBG_13_43_22]|nr:MAG: hypothetical protein A2Y79_00300 [Deltaproteobacteria bacterium RBG_13_43_22]